MQDARYLLESEVPDEKMRNAVVELRLVPLDGVSQLLSIELEKAAALVAAQ